MIWLEDSFGGEEENAVDEDNEEDEDDLAITVNIVLKVKRSDGLWRCFFNE